MTEITSDRANNILKMLVFLAGSKKYLVTKNRDWIRIGYVHQGETYTLSNKNGFIIAQLIAKHGTFYYQEF